MRIEEKPMKVWKRRLAQAVLMLAALGIVAPSLAQSYPGKPIRIMLP